MIPKIRQYHAKGFKFPFSSRRIAPRITTSPNPHEDKKPIKQEEKDKEGREDSSLAILRSSRQLPPIIVGIDKRNENRTASFGLQPSIRAQEIVDALLEIPGMSAAD